MAPSWAVSSFLASSGSPVAGCRVPQRGLAAVRRQVDAMQRHRIAGRTGDFGQQRGQSNEICCFAVLLDPVRQCRVMAQRGGVDGQIEATVCQVARHRIIGPDRQRLRPQAGDGGAVVAFGRCWRCWWRG